MNPSKSLLPTRSAFSLSTPEAYPQPTSGVDVIETHMSWVFLTAERVYKLKKPVRMAFLDFSTIEQRRFYCEESIRLNRRLAPEVYLGVVALRKTDSRLSLEGGGEVVDWLEEMVRLPADAMLDVAIRASRPIEEHIGRVVEVLATLYRRAPTMILSCEAYRSRLAAQTETRKKRS